MNRLSRSIRSIRWHRLAAAMAYCQSATTKNDDSSGPAVVVELNQIAEQLTHKYLLQQTCTQSVNSSCQMITIALVTLSDASQKYKEKLINIMDVLENGDWSDDELDSVLMEFRHDITDAKTFYLDSISVMDSALQLGQSTIQMSFTVAAITVFNSISERIYSAEREFQSCMEEIRIVEDKFTELLANTIKKSKNKDNGK